MVGTVYTQAGEEWTVDKLDSTVSTKAEYIGWGTGSTDPVKGNTGLETPGAEARVQGTQSQPSADKARVVGTITCGVTGKTITEAALFTDAAAGVCVIRSVFAGVPVVQNDQIQFTFELEFS